MNIYYSPFVELMAWAMLILGMVAAFITVLFFVGMFANFTLEKVEIAECKKWQSQAKQFDGYYITKWQKVQCDYYNVSINAPVK